MRISKRQNSLGIVVGLLLLSLAYICFISTKIDTGSSTSDPSFYEGHAEKQYDITTTGDYQIDRVIKSSEKELILENFGSIDFGSDYYIKHYKELYPLDLKSLKTGNIVKVMFKPLPKGWVVCRIDTLPKDNGFNLGENGYIFVDTIKEVDKNHILFLNDTTPWRFDLEEYIGTYAKMYPLNLENFKAGDEVRVTVKENARSFVIKKIELLESSFPHL